MLRSQAQLQLTPDQDAAIARMIDWWQERRKEQEQGQARAQAPLLTVGGYAGTGKTTIIRMFSERIRNIDVNNFGAFDNKIQIEYLSYTGRATLNVKKKLQAAGINGDCRTIHRFMYKAVLDKNGRIIGWRLEPPKELPDLIIIDEASMIPKSVYKDLLSLGVPIIAVGDHGQLPPIGSDNFNLMEKPDITLETIHRQDAQSQIIHLASMARRGLFIPLKRYSDCVAHVASLASVDNVLENAPQDDTIIITATNLQRVIINRMILEARQKDPEYPEPGDRIVCLKNIYTANPPIFNGTLCTVIDVEDGSKPWQWQIRFRTDEGEEYQRPVSQLLFNNAKGELPSNMNTRDAGDLFDFGYAVTCHKAQGSEFDFVFVIGYGFGDRRRWLYTALTRSKKNLYLCKTLGV